MRSKLYLPSIVHDVKREVGVAEGQVMPLPPHTHGMQREFGLWGPLIFSLDLMSALPKKTRF